MNEWIENDDEDEDEDESKSSLADNHTPSGIPPLPPKTFLAMFPS